MPDYQQGKIYTIRCHNDTSLIYVGSTIQTLSKRWGGHKIDSLKNKNRLIYQSINDEWDNWYIELHELFPCNSKMELEKREGEIIREIGTLNKNIAGRTRKEYKKENVDKIKEYQKLYNKDNADKIKDKIREYQEQNAEKISEYMKEYKNNNSEMLSAYRKEYREKNSEQIKKYHKEYYNKKKVVQTPIISTEK